MCLEPPTFKSSLRPKETSDKSLLSLFVILIFCSSWIYRYCFHFLIDCAEVLFISIIEFFDAFIHVASSDTFLAHLTHPQPCWGDATVTPFHRGRRNVQGFADCKALEALGQRPLAALPGP